MTLDALLAAARAQLAAMPPCPENQATAVALANAVQWQACRRSVWTAAAPAEGELPQGLAWAEV